MCDVTTQSARDTCCKSVSRVGMNPATKGHAGGLRVETSFTDSLREAARQGLQVAAMGLTAEDRNKNPENHSVIEGLHSKA